MIWIWFKVPSHSVCRCAVFSSVQGGERPAAVCQSRLNRGATGTEDGTQHLVGLLRRHKPLALLLSPGRPAFFCVCSAHPCLLYWCCSSSKRQQREQPSAGGGVKRAMNDLSSLREPRLCLTLLEEKPRSWWSGPVCVSDSGIQNV